MSCDDVEDCWAHLRRAGGIGDGRHGGAAREEAEAVMVCPATAPSWKRGGTAVIDRSEARLPFRVANWVLSVWFFLGRGSKAGLAACCLCVLRLKALRGSWEDADRAVAVGPAASGWAWVASAECWSMDSCLPVPRPACQAAGSEADRSVQIRSSAGDDARVGHKLMV